MATIIHVGEVAVSATGNGGLGVARLGPTFDPTLVSTVPVPKGLFVTNLPERGAYYRRPKAQLNDGVPNAIAKMACHSLSTVSYGNHVNSDGLNEPLGVDIGSDARWVADVDGSYTVTGPDPNGNYVSSWAPSLGAGGLLQFAVDPGEHAANPTTGILVDPTNKYWSRAGQVNLTAVVDDQNVCLLTPGPSPIRALTALLVATPYEADWYFGDLMAFYDAGQYDPEQAKLACIRMDADELQLWVRGQKYTERVVNPWALSQSIGQQLDGRRPIIVGWSIDASEISDTHQTGKGSLVVVDPYTSSGIDYTFWNRSSDQDLSAYLRIGMIGAQSLVANPFNDAAIDWQMRLDIYELNTWARALSLDELTVAASRLDSIYGIVQ